jgi:hypothetical protein
MHLVSFIKIVLYYCSFHRFFQFLLYFFHSKTEPKIKIMFDLYLCLAYKYLNSYILLNILKPTKVIIFPIFNIILAAILFTLSAIKIDSFFCLFVISMAVFLILYYCFVDYYNYCHSYYYFVDNC